MQRGGRVRRKYRLVPATRRKSCEHSTSILAVASNDAAHTWRTKQANGSDFRNLPVAHSHANDAHHPVLDPAHFGSGWPHTQLTAPLQPAREHVAGGSFSQQLSVAAQAGRCVAISMAAHHHRSTRRRGARGLLPGWAPSYYTAHTRPAVEQRTKRCIRNAAASLRGRGSVFHAKKGTFSVSERSETRSAGDESIETSE